MIVTILTNGTPTNYDGASHKEDITVISRNEAEATAPFNVCELQCPYVEPKFSELGAITDELKNDKTDLILRKSINTDTIVYKLYKCEAGVNTEKATLDNNTYGNYYSEDGFVAFVADWNLIYNAFGHGRYYFLIERNILGQSLDDITSWFYDLELYSEEAANDTVRIESIKSGCIEGGFNYLGLTWESQIRFRGTFGRPTQSLEKDHYVTQGRKDEQIRDSILTTYLMQLELVPYDVITPFIKDTLLANDMFITSYSYDGFIKPYLKFNVVPEEPQDPTYFERNENGVFEFTFTDKFKTPVKSNFV